MNETQPFRIYRGLWWVPGFEQERFIGELVREGDRGMELKLVIPSARPIPDARPIKTVFGTDEHGKPVTLFHVFREQGRVTGALTELILGVGYCFHGAHYRRWGEATFREVDIDFKNLSEWVGISGFEDCPRIENESWVRHVLPQDRDYEIGADLAIRFCAERQGKSSNRLRTMSEKWVLRLKYREAVSFNRIRENVRSLRRFFSLGIGDQVPEGALILRKEHRTKNAYSTNITALVPGLRWSEAREVDCFRMLFTFSDVERDLGRVVREWMALEQRLRDVVHLVFSVRENKHLYTNHRFLFLAQALEVYHRCWPERYAQTLEPRKAFRERLRRIKGKLEREDSEWISKKVSFANQATLDARIREVLADKSEWIAKLIPNPREFATSVRLLRNHFTHWPESDAMRNRVADLDDFDLAERLFRLLLVCIVSDLGLPASVIEKAARYSAATYVAFTETDEPGDASNPQIALT